MLLAGILGDAFQPTETVSDYLAVAALSWLVADKLSLISDDDLREMLDLVEEAVDRGCEETKTAATTGFLENLQNRGSRGGFDFCRIAQSLGPASREFCEEWDRFSEG
jgi:hypothetical protein